VTLPVIFVKGTAIAELVLNVIVVSISLIRYFHAKRLRRDLLLPKKMKGAFPERVAPIMVTMCGTLGQTFSPA
jgi:hypothetical protein